MPVCVKLNVCVEVCVELRVSVEVSTITSKGGASSSGTEPRVPQHTVVKQALRLAAGAESAAERMAQELSSRATKANDVPAITLAGTVACLLALFPQHRTVPLLRAQEWWEPMARALTPAAAAAGGVAWPKQ